MNRYWANCFWLVLPVLGLNLALGGQLPAVFDPEIAAARVPAGLAAAETVMRL